ncbi:pathogenesis-related homeodomain protein [Primulina huaijiensis]|uniref:pathogenesis-related homeodomain protein n=1 Tax=Primulina huaijiensis TaxID=1492673 RepID=UPI003CC6F520
MSLSADCGLLMPENSELDSKRTVTESVVFKDANLISMEKISDKERIVGPNTRDIAQIFSAEPSGQLWEVKISSTFEDLEEPFQNFPVDVNCSDGSTGHASVNPNSGKLEPIQVDAVNEFGRMEAEYKGIELQQRKRKAKQTSAVTSSWALHPQSPEKPMVFEAESVISEGNASGEKKRRGRKKKEVERGSVNEFLKTKIHLRYLLHRIKYEQSLIDAYSAEGWKGQSLEKLKPEKELQNAKSHILRYKLKIRELFQHIDQSLAAGKLPESLFDSKGEIYSEDIFCAKCGSKDLQVDNDIILCDGACQRGFHQFCLEPPLLKEQIPPGDEGWLCPGCDCKLDCIHLLKDFQESKVSILDNWEKIFPEAVVASGKKLDDNHGSSQDDSQDNDSDPDKPDKLAKVTGDESSSNECPYLPASDYLLAPPDNEKFLALPSDDSEDDDFDPAAPDKDELVKLDTSSSDFSSDFEDLVGLIDDADVPGVNTGHSLSPPGYGSPSSGCDRKISKVGGMMRESQKDYLSYLLGNSDEPSSSKRHVERLDYKKLHDETYGNYSDSSDEDFEDTMGSKRRNTNRQKTVVVSPYKTSVAKTQRDMKDENQEEIQHRPEITHKRLNETGIQNSSAIVDSAGPKTKRSTYKILGEAQTQRLFESFQENQYPERAVKEKLAKELGLSIQQVGKWFDNTRWRFNHRPQTLSCGVESAPINSTSVPGNEPELEKATVTNNNSSNAFVAQNPHCSSQSEKFSS